MDRLPFWVNTIDALGAGPGVPARSAAPDGCQPSFLLPSERAPDGCAASLASVHPFFSTPTLRLRDLFAYRAWPKHVSSPEGVNPQEPRGEADGDGGPATEAKGLSASRRRKPPVKGPSPTPAVERSQEEKMDTTEESDSEDDVWEEILLANYGIDLPWLLQEVPEITRVKHKLVILSGEKGTATHRREKRFSPSSSGAGGGETGGRGGEKRSPDGFPCASPAAGNQGRPSAKLASHRNLMKNEEEEDEKKHQKKVVKEEEEEEEWQYAPVPISLQKKNPFIAAVRDASIQRKGSNTVTHGADFHRSSLPCLPSELEQKMVVIEPFLPLLYGTHHTKMALLVNRHGLRVAIFTANFLFSDWHAKTQGIYTQDFPRCAACGTATAAAPSASPLVEPSPGQDFKRQLQRYLHGCGVRPVSHPNATPFAASASAFLFGRFGEHSFLDAFDFSTVRVRLVTSVPGCYRGRRSISLFGMGRLAALFAYYHSGPPGVKEEAKTEARMGPERAPNASLSSSSVLPSFTAELNGMSSRVERGERGAVRPPLPRASVLSWQYSSQGSLDSRFFRYFSLAMQGRPPFCTRHERRKRGTHVEGETAEPTPSTRSIPTPQPPSAEDDDDEEELPRVQVIYPTEWEVRRSLEGWRGGLSLPVSLRCCHPFINARLHRWTGREGGPWSDHVVDVSDRKGGGGGERCRPRGTDDRLRTVSDGVALPSSLDPPARSRRHVEAVYVVESESEEEGEEGTGPGRQRKEEEEKNACGVPPLPLHESAHPTTMLRHPAAAAGPHAASYATALPHIKSYAGVVYPSQDTSPAPRYVSWFMLTSANLSKAAWGLLTPIPPKRTHGKGKKTIPQKSVPPPPSAPTVTVTRLPSTLHARHPTQEREGEKRRKRHHRGGRSGPVEEEEGHRSHKEESESEVDDKEEEDEEDGWKLTIWSYECGVLYLPSVYFSSFAAPSTTGLSPSEANPHTETSPISPGGGKKCAFTCTPALSPLPPSPFSFAPHRLLDANDTSPISFSSSSSSSSSSLLLYPTRCGITGKEETVLYLPYDILQPVPYASTPYLYAAEMVHRRRGAAAHLDVVSSSPERDTTTPVDAGGRGGACTVEEHPTHRRRSRSASAPLSHHGEALPHSVDSLVPNDDIPWVLEVPHRGVDSHGREIHEMASSGVEAYGPSSWGVRLCPGGGVLQGL